MKSILNDIILYMQEYFNEVTVEGLANYFNYNPYYFSRKFRQLTGYTVSDYLSSLKIDYAKSLLIYSDYSVTDISLESGFESFGTFSTTFKRKTGISPQKYLENMEKFYEETITFQDTLKKKDLYGCFSHRFEDKNNLDVELIYPVDSNSTISYVGLFKTPIPNHRPVAGRAITDNRYIRFSNILNGEFYILACAITDSVDSINFYDLSQALRSNLTINVFSPKTTIRKLILS